MFLECHQASIVVFATRISPYDFVSIYQLISASHLRNSPPVAGNHTCELDKMSTYIRGAPE